MAKEILLLNNSTKHSQPKVEYVGDHTSTSDMANVVNTIGDNLHLTGQICRAELSPN